MRLLVDQQLPALLAEKLRQLGHDAAHVKAVGLTDATDARIWAHARASDAHIMTKDHDFLHLAMADPAGPAVVRLAFGNCGNRLLLLRVQAALPDVERRLAAGGRVVEVR